MNFQVPHLKPEKARLVSWRLHLDDGNLITVEDATDQCLKLLKQLKVNIHSYNSLAENFIRVVHVRLRFPTFSWSQIRLARNGSSAGRRRTRGRTGDASDALCRDRPPPLQILSTVCAFSLRPSHMICIPV